MNSLLLDGWQLLCDTFSWLHENSFAGQWLLIVIGWLVVNKQTNSRERRKEIRSTIDSIEKLILEIEVAARNYYKLEESTEDAQNQALQIKASFRTLSARIKLLRTYSRIRILKFWKNKFSISDTKLIDFRSAVTGGEFESSSRKAYAANHRVFSEISAAAGSLIDHLNEFYANI
ncbi:hypothetical protein [Burkholderia territorii]|uniref:hypothetical protein n=1 Tax=Burkholderia territorii TaxID=1503055 RepID=UPI0012DA745C|nr:hypothetical protein [Burkholderia territorii]